MLLLRRALPLIMPGDVRAQGTDDAPTERLRALERRLGGRLGVAALAIGSGQRIAWRANERFAMCSTFKWLLATQVLAAVDAGREQLDRFVAYGAADLPAYAPVTRAHLNDGGMTVGALCEAAVEHSDNAAANLLLATVGGPAGLTRFLRSIGDDTTRLDRTEPDLNSALPGDPRDTTSPAAMVRDLETIFAQRRVLSAGTRSQLLAWLRGSTTGATRLRAGLPHAWRVGDKSGSGDHGATNDVAVATLPDGTLVLIAAYGAGSTASAAERDRALAQVGEFVGAWAAPARRDLSTTTGIHPPRTSAH